jgi:hypothetical protein
LLSLPTPPFISRAQLIGSIDYPLREFALALLSRDFANAFTSQQ